MSQLALIAGAGRLPVLLADRQAVAPVIVAVAGHPPEGLTPQHSLRIETLATTLETLRAAGVREICLAGRVTRPEVDPGAIEPRSAPLVERLVAGMAQGDDGALRVLIAILEEAGFVIRGAHDLAPELLPQPGFLAGSPSEAMARDARRGAEIVAALGAADLGQACIVAGGQPLALEALPGTDWMIRSLLARGARDGQRDPALPAGGILYKAPKPGQELRVDMPTIGPETVKAAAAAGLEGLVVAAGGVLVIDAPICAELAREAGLALWIRRP